MEWKRFRNREAGKRTELRAVCSDFHSKLIVESIQRDLKSISECIHKYFLPNVNRWKSDIFSHTLKFQQAWDPFTLYYNEWILAEQESYRREYLKKRVDHCFQLCSENFRAFSRQFDFPSISDRTGFHFVLPVSFAFPKSNFKRNMKIYEIQNFTTPFKMTMQI